MTSLYNKYQIQDVVFIGISDDPKKKLENFLNNLDVPFWIGNDTDRSVFKDYGIRGIPHYVIINKKGSVVYSDNFFDETILKEVVETDTYVKKKPSEDEKTSAKIPDFEDTTYYPGADPAYLYSYKLKYDDKAPYATTYSLVIRPSLYQNYSGYGISYNGRRTGITYPYCTITDFLLLSQDKSSEVWIAHEQDSLPHYDIIYSKKGEPSNAYAEIEAAFLEFTNMEIETEKKEKELKRLVKSTQNSKLLTAGDLPKGAEKLYKSVSYILSYLEEASGSIHLLEDSLLDSYVSNKSLEFKDGIHNANYKELQQTLKSVGVEIIQDKAVVDIVVVKPTE